MTSLGFGKVTFASVESAIAALSLHDALLDGRTISVRPFDVVPLNHGGHGILPLPEAELPFLFSEGADNVATFFEARCWTAFSKVTVS